MARGRDGRYYDAGGPGGSDWPPFRDSIPVSPPRLAPEGVQGEFFRHGDEVFGTVVTGEKPKETTMTPEAKRRLRSAGLQGMRPDGIAVDDMCSKSRPMDPETIRGMNIFRKARGLPLLDGYGNVLDTSTGSSPRAEAAPTARTTSASRSGSRGSRLARSKTPAKRERGQRRARQGSGGRKEAKRSRRSPASKQGSKNKRAKKSRT